MDTTLFMTTKFTERKVFCPLPKLKHFFTDGALAGFTLKNLTSAEWYKCQEAVGRNRNILELIGNLAKASTAPGEMVSAISDFVADDKTLPDDFVLNLNLFVYGVAEPKVDHEFAKKFAKNFPMDFTAVTNKIFGLCGEGAEVKKKPSSSGVAPKSETP